MAASPHAASSGPFSRTSPQAVLVVAQARRMRSALAACRTSPVARYAAAWRAAIAASSSTKLTWPQMSRGAAGG